MTPAKERAIAQKRQQQERAKHWRGVCDSLYCRAIFADIIQPLLDEGATLDAIAEHLHLARIPKVRGTARWSAQCVSALIARVAAVHLSACDPKGWLREIQRLTPDLGDALDGHHENQ
jgi:hypothetical protein